jgi:flagellar motor switch protein FliN/FliY
VSTWESAAGATPAGGATPAADAGNGARIGSSIEALFDVSLPVVIEIGRTSLTVQEVLELTTGSVIELDRIVGEPVDIYVSDRKLAQGEVVVVGEHFGVRVTRVLSAAAESLA